MKNLRLTAITIGCFGMLMVAAAGPGVSNATKQSARAASAVAPQTAAKKRTQRNWTVGTEPQHDKENGRFASAALTGRSSKGLRAGVPTATPKQCRQMCGDDELCMICCLQPDPAHCQ